MGLRKYVRMRKFKLYIIFIAAGIVLLLISAWAKDHLLPTSKIRAVYLVSGKGELDQTELTKHPEVVVTGSFKKFKEYAKQRVALWIDKNAINLVNHTWFYHEPQLYYPVVLVGYGDENYSFGNMLGINGVGDDPFSSSNELSTNRRPDPGFSVRQLEKFNLPNDYLGFPYPKVVINEGYRYKPHVEGILNITNGLLDGTLK